MSETIILTKTSPTHPSENLSVFTTAQCNPAASRDAIVTHCKKLIAQEIPNEPKPEQNGVWVSLAKTQYHLEVWQPTPATGLGAGCKQETYIYNRNKKTFELE